MNINFSIIEQVVNDYLYKEQEYKLFTKEWATKRWKYKTTEEEKQYTKREEQSTAAENAVRQVCAVLYIRPEVIIPIIKACNRYTKNHGKWDRYADTGRLNSEQKERLFEMAKTEPLLDWDVHYNSTGRVKKYIA